MLILYYRGLKLKLISSINKMDSCSNVMNNYNNNYQNNTKATLKNTNYKMY